MTSNDSLVGIFQTLFRWRKALIRVTLAVGILTALVSLFLPNYYEASTSFYAASVDMTNPDGIFGPPGKAVEYFGSGADRDRILTIASSAPFYDQMIDTFNLFDRYNIKQTDPKAREKARMKFAKHCQVVETKYDGIQITMEDKDPKEAAILANAAREIIGQIAIQYVRQTQEQILHTLDGSINQKQAYLIGLSDSLNRIQQTTGVYDTEDQNKNIGLMLSYKTIELAGDKAKLESYRKIGYNNRDTIANVTARIAALESQLADLTGKTSGGGFDIARFNAGSGLVAALQQQYDNTKNQMSYEIEKAKHLRAIMEGNTSAIIPFETAMAPVSKSRPKRSILVLSAMFLTFLFGSLGVLLLEQYRKINWKDPEYAG
ncbi:MAG: hypothetical protein KA479_10070 [Saprospiraceae bacterium]|nr:hypothetical protein [Saprospiraceae bacterium]